MKIIKRNISELSQDPANARKHNERNLESIVASLRRFGQQTPIVIDSSNVVRKGNGTIEAAKRLGWDTINCVVTDLKSSDAISYAIADNRTAELAEWDDEVLAAQLNGLLADDPELLEVAGFTEEELAELLADSEIEPEVIEDEVPEPPPDPITKPGDLWLLGEHRVLCGDSTKAEDVARLMNGVKAQVLLTDPPYGMRLDTDFSTMPRGANKYEPVIGDDADFDFGNIGAHWNCSRMAVWGGGWFYSTLPAGGSWLVWDKQPQHTVAGPQNHFEECWIWPHKKRIIIRHLWTGFTAKEKNEARSHPTQKPVAVIIELARFLGDWGLCSDPFLGSGTTLIAAEQLGRKCYGMEISPAYCDVIVKRWETLTGKKATLAS
jgi:DNA modification methylase